MCDGQRLLTLSCLVRPQTCNGLVEMLDRLRRMSGFEKLPAIGLHSRPTRRIDRFRPIEQVGRCVDLADLPALIGQGHQDSCVQDHFVRALSQQPAQRASAPTQSDERTPAIAFGDRPRPQRPDGSRGLTGATPARPG